MDRRASVLLVCSFTTVACAQDPAAPPGVVITGSRLILGENALPVQVIGREQIERSGVQTVEELLDRISANSRPRSM